MAKSRSSSHTGSKSMKCCGSKNYFYKEVIKPHETAPGNFLILQDEYYLLQENGDKIKLETSI